MSARAEALAIARQWIQKAEEDLRVARHSLALKRNCPVAVVCFHCQQCIEKYLKAVLTFHGVAFPKTHDLQQLALLVPQKVGLTVPPRQLSMTNRYAVETRYPGDWEPISVDEAQEAVRFARRVRRSVRAVLPRELLRK